MSPPDRPSAPPPLTHAHVLVVDADAPARARLRAIFAGAGARVSVAGGADEALRLAGADAPELAVIDTALSETSAAQPLLPALQAIAPEVECIWMTGQASLEAAIAAMRHGAFASVPKPVDPDDLLAVSSRAVLQVLVRRDRISLAQELRDSVALYRGVVDHVEAIIAGLSADGRVVFCNRYGHELTGFRPSTVYGRPFVDAWAVEAERAAMARDLDRVLRGRTIRDHDRRLRCSDGRVRTVRWLLTPLPGGVSEAGDQAVRLLAVGIDRTERIELERRWIEAESVAAMGRITSGLAHEVRNPLNAASLQLQLLRRTARKLEDSERGARIEARAAVVSTELERLSALLNEYLDLARPRRLELAPLDLRELLDEVAAYERPLIEAAGHTLMQTVREPTFVVGDRSKLRQVLFNLISNALEAMEGTPGGTIRLEMRAAHPPPSAGAGADTDGTEASERRRASVEVRVRDTGPGLTEAEGSEAFQPFHTTKATGTGLGLSIVERIVGWHGGRARLGPAEDGPGAVASFTLQPADRP